MCCFFLFENHNDLLITNDLVTALQLNPFCSTKKGIFDSDLDLAISNIIADNSNNNKTELLLNKVREQFANNKNLNDTVTKVHLMFCLLFQLLNESICTKPDIEQLVKNVQETTLTLQTKLNEAVYLQMWNGATNFDFHIDLLNRFFKVYAIFGWLSLARTETYCSNSLDTSQRTVFAWITEEFLAERSEGKINSMIFTAYYKMLLICKKINQKEYLSALIDQYHNLHKTPIIHYEYTENSFPDDNDPVSSQFADLLDTIKLFSESFSFVFCFMQEIFIQTDDISLKNQIRIDTEQYYIQMPYAFKGFVIDTFIAENAKYILQSCISVEDCLSFLNTVFLHRQISTAIHFSMVSRLAVLCYNHFSAARPELFSHVPGFDSKEKALFFVHNAALCHDIGKLYCTNLVNLHFRKITDTEFSELSKHSQEGADFIEQIPLLRPFADIVRGHHKSYDGNSGYPESFDNTKSPYKPIIDLITICDSIDAATDMLGRNYATGKTFNVLLQELIAQAGTRYSPELVSLLANDHDLCTQISELTGNGRTSVYYEMYYQYVSPHITFSSQDEKTVHPFCATDIPAIIDFYKSCYPKIPTAELFNQHLTGITGGANSRGFILSDQRGIVYGVLFGRILIRLTNDSDDDYHKLSNDSQMQTDSYKNDSSKLSTGCRSYFNIDEILILPKFRRKGLGTTLVSFAESELHSAGCCHLSITIEKDFHEESFFWINGFCDTRKTLMEKNI